ncbi:MAG: zeta toxin family protein [Saprospiraceae bacterium]|uniref:Zeta toxin family protein n=1 Tax=Candidatus Opimibacter skivensis TaxID=2982028 RepID=A0A9D7XRG5_9BACT|nr:zeta toxin family protein [Candidatus Opimibacter skivensis]
MSNNISKKIKTGTLRLRVFAGPNGSGKSTIIKGIQDARVKGRKLDLGTYINADDIAQLIFKNKFTFEKYDLNVSKKAILFFASNSGLISEEFSETMLESMFNIKKNEVILKHSQHFQNLAQIIARFLREKMLENRKRFSFETVFSHPSNIDIMRRAKEAGYKVYLYFVSTEDPEINKFRVKFRITQKGHAVPEEKIATRYYRSLELLYDAAELAHQCYFFDNSINDETYRLINHFKMRESEKVWDTKRKSGFTNWFKKYYWDKMK